MSARRPWALPFVPVYRAVSALEAAAYRAGLFATRQLSWPVISVGSLSAGGAGKTPVVISLANMLQERGWHVDVLSRGYRRNGSGSERVELTGMGSGEAARRYGDEPTLLVERTNVAVWVGSDRFVSGQLAEQHGLPGIHILDDGFQHGRLSRDFDLVLVTAEDLADTLLPAGNLREPLSALLRADAVVIREEERESIENKVRALAGPKLPIWSVRRRLRFPQPLGVFSAGLRPLAFCAIARPEGFAALLQASGCGIIDTVVFDDHHRYDSGDLDQVLKAAHDLKATGFVTTEKDAVKLSPELRLRLESFGPLAVVALDADFVYKAPVIRALEERLKAPGRASTPQQSVSARHGALIR